MNPLREAAELALTALASTSEVVIQNNKEIEIAIHALRSALACPEPAPMAWIVFSRTGRFAYVTTEASDIDKDKWALPFWNNQTSERHYE